MVESGGTLTDKNGKVCDCVAELNLGILKRLKVYEYNASGRYIYHLRLVYAFISVINYLFSHVNSEGVIASLSNVVHGDIVARLAKHSGVAPSL